MFRTLDELGDTYREWNIEGKHNVEDISRMYMKSVVIYEGKKYQCKERSCALWSESLGDMFLGLKVDGDYGYVPFKDIDNSFPEMGYYNVDGNAVLLSRDIRSRNWRYAFHESNSSVGFPYVREGQNLQYSLLRINAGRMSSSSLKTSIYLNCDDEFKGIDEAVQLVSEGSNYAVPVSRKIAVASNPYKDEVGIFLLGSLVGIAVEGRIDLHEEWAMESLKEVV